MPNRSAPCAPLQFTSEELDALQRDPDVRNRERRTFLKWSTALAAQATAGGALDLLSGAPARADDTMANVARWVYSVCGYCSVGCGLHIGVDSRDKAVFVKGNARHPTNSGHVCVKGLYEYKVLDDGQLRVGSRARYPLLRNASGDYERITWDRAIDLLARRIADAVTTSGPDSVGIYNTGQWTLEEYYSMGKLGKGAIGTGVMDSNTRLCMAAAVYGYMSTFGSDGPPAATATSSAPTASSSSAPTRRRCIPRHGGASPGRARRRGDPG
jgi:anaerobic selenocysteine-containing dehydrogenase